MNSITTPCTHALIHINNELSSASVPYTYSHLVLPVDLDSLPLSFDVEREAARR